MNVSWLHKTPKGDDLKGRRAVPPSGTNNEKQVDARRHAEQDPVSG